jgi:hypothetical protein
MAALLSGSPSRTATLDVLVRDLVRADFALRIRAIWWNECHWVGRRGDRDGGAVLLEDSVEVAVLERLMELDITKGQMIC